MQGTIGGRFLWLLILLAGLSTCMWGAASEDKLSVYPPVPGLDESPHYRFRVRKLDSGEWLSPFAFMTRAGRGRAYYGAMDGWTQTYCNFEMGENVAIEIEITRLDPATGAKKDINTAVPHPRRKVRSWRVENGRVYLVIENPALFAVDIDGMYDDRPLPRNPPSNQPMTGEDGVHIVTIFANPFLADKPDLNDPTVYAVEPGTLPPEDGDWETLYFLPGVHQFWEGTWTTNALYTLLDGKNYYIPGDAVVHGNMRSLGGPNTIRLFGHGTLTQERITHALGQDPPLQGRERGLTSALKIFDPVGTVVEGLTFTDSPDHTLWINGPYNPDPDTFNYVRWVKVVTWRANGDGITVGDNDFLEDSFIRVQDDGTYLKGRGIRRMVYWTDCNGKSLKVNMLTRMRKEMYEGRQMFIEDIDIIYGRSSWPGASWHEVLGGSHDFPGPGNSQCNDGSYIVFRNINFSDPMPLRKLIGYNIRGGHRRDLQGIRFENIRATAPSLYGFENSFRGRDDGQGSLRDFVLDNVVVGGRQISSTNDLEISGSVVNMMFENTEPTETTFQNHSGWGKWYVREDWSAEVEPADQDIVKHTEEPGTLIVDCPAWAGTLDIAHAETAAIRLAHSGRLFVSDRLTLGNAQGGRGVLQLLDGEVVLRSARADALEVANGGIHIERNGLLLWAGDRTDDVKALLADGHISLGEPRQGIPEAAPYDRVRREILAAAGDETMLPRTPSPILVWQSGERAVFADYDNINPGFTTFWVGDNWGVLQGGSTSEYEDEHGQLWRLHTFADIGAHRAAVRRRGMFEYLIVGGGGGGGGASGASNGGGAGGGAGGLLSGTITVSAGWQEVVVGAGGAGGEAGGQPGSNGSDSSAFGLLALGGGGGAGRTAGAPGNAGGSGGGGENSETSAYRAGGAGLQSRSDAGGYGHSGGDGSDNPNDNGAGGGGAGGAGASSRGTHGRGTGGIGRASAITGTSAMYAGGGGGGSGWNRNPGAGGGGGGGAGSGSNTAGEDGQENTGGGGGGAGRSGNNPGGSGGSGIVIVRYQI